MNISGWTPDSYDGRDILMSYQTIPKLDLAKSIDLRSNKGFKKVYNQGSLGSCTSNAICSAFEYKQTTQGLDKFDPSRLFVYYNTRKIMGTIGRDSGASIRDGMKTINREGMCTESYFPYDISKFTQQPSSEAYIDGKYHTTVLYTSVPRTLDDFKTALTNGHPIVFGFNVFENFTSGVSHRGCIPCFRKISDKWDTMNEPMPMPSGKRIGGHAVLAVGYDDDIKCFIIRNSWGSGWGNNGYFLMPYDFIVSKHCRDFWIIEKIQDTG